MRRALAAGLLVHLVLWAGTGGPGAEAPAWTKTPAPEVEVPVLWVKAPAPPPPTTSTTAPAPPVTQPTPRPEPPAPPTTSPPPPPPEDVMARCRRVVAQATVSPAPGWGPIVCEPTNGVWAGYVTSDGGPVHITPPDFYTDDQIAFTIKHEVGHTWCLHEHDDISEPCADAWAHSH